MLGAALFLLVILSLLAPALQGRLQRWLHHRPAGVFAAPALLSAAFCAIAWRHAALSPALAGLIAAYTLAPTLCAFAQGSPAGGTKQASWLDLAAILMLWLPLEFAAGGNLVPKPSQGIVHAAAYGVAITLALWLFLLFRGLRGMKYRLPSHRQDLINPLLGFVAAAPVLIVLGLALGFLQPFHAPVHSAPALAARLVFIFLATALPEEILFRGLIQNWLMQRLGQTPRALLLAGLIFGCAHLNNGPGSLPNWRYMILATIAGVIYGRVFQKSTSILSSSALHALVNGVKYAVF